ncbi:hypothetical protein AB5J72_04950 [Streptomyces sp. CG1]
MAVVEGGDRAFMAGLHASALFAGALCLVGAGLAAAGLRGGTAAQTD